MRTAYRAVRHPLLVGGFAMAFFVVLLPLMLGSALGGYLFFAQHSFKRMLILSPEFWAYYRAAMESSSYMKLNKVMQWFTGNDHARLARRCRLFPGESVG